MPTLSDVLTQAAQNNDAALERLFELLKIPSISTDPAYKAQCQQAADWLVTDLKSFGVEASRRDTPGHPMVVGHSPAVAGKPRLLFYGHYDVQPVDPLDLWHSDPFSPALEQDGNNSVIPVSYTHLTLPTILLV